MKIEKSMQKVTRKLCYHKDDRMMHLIYECPERFRMDIENLKSVAFAVPVIIAIRVLVGVVNPNLGEEKVVGGRGWYYSKECW